VLPRAANMDVGEAHRGVSQPISAKSLGYRLRRWPPKGAAGGRMGRPVRRLTWSNTKGLTRLGNRRSRLGNRLRH
jgi:hypothetical protein